MQCLGYKLNINYRIIKFQTLEHFLRFLPDAKFNPKQRTCSEFSGRYGSNPRPTLGLRVDVIKRPRFLSKLYCAQCRINHVAEVAFATG